LTNAVNTMHPVIQGPYQAAGPSASHHSHKHPITGVKTICSLDIWTSQTSFNHVSQLLR